MNNYYTSYPKLSTKTTIYYHGWCYKKAIALAEAWQYEVEQTTKPSEKKEQQRYQSLTNDQISKYVLIVIFDRLFRAFKATKVIANLHRILKTYGIPVFFI